MVLLRGHVTCHRIRPSTGSKVFDLVECEPCDLMRLIRDGEFNHGLHLSVLLLAAMRGRLPISQADSPLSE